MKIHIMCAYGGEPALIGLGLSYGLTTPYAYWDDVPDFLLLFIKIGED